MQPGEYVLPVSQDSLPTMTPSPQTGAHTPCELAEYPLLAQVRHWLADLQVLQEALQLVHPLAVSKYCPSGQTTALRTSFWQTP